MMTVPCQIGFGMIIGGSFIVGAAVMAVICLIPELWRENE